MEFKTGTDNSKDRVKLKSGESIKGVFMGDTHEFKQHWKDGKPSLCPGETDCEKCANGDKAKFRFSLNLIIKENGTYVAKVFEQGWKVFLDLKALHEGGYHLEQYLMKITRNGSTMNDTTYSIVPVPDGKLTAAQLKEVAAVKLIQLIDEPKNKDIEKNPKVPELDEIPF